MEDVSALYAPRTRSESHPMLRVFSNRDASPERLVQGSPFMPTVEAPYRPETRPLRPIAGRHGRGKAPSTMVRVGAMRGFSALVTSLNGRPETLLRRHRINPDATKNEESLIPMRDFVLLLEASATSLNAPAFGLMLAQRQDIGMLGPLAIVLQNAESVSEAMRLFARYLFVHAPGIALTLLERSPSGAKLCDLRFELLSPDVPTARQVTDLGLTVIHRIFRALVGDAYALRHVSLPHQPLAKLSIYEKAFGCSVRTAQPFAALHFERTLLSHRLTSGNVALRNIGVAYLDSHHQDPKQSASKRVDAALRALVGMGSVSKTAIASALAIHPRSLLRKLNAEGTSFEALRDDVRRQRARRMLVSTTIPIGQVAGLLGLSEQAVLTRLCKRWFGMTPTDLRRHADGAHTHPKRPRVAG